MPLSDNMSSVYLTFRCPVCRHPLVKRGGWFRVIGRFECAGCQSNIRLTYRDKVALFEEHAALVYQE